MTYRDILTFDDSLLEELNTYDAKLIRFLQITKLSIHEFIIEFNQPSLRKDFLERIDDFESFMRDCESCNRFEWRDFLNLPTDIDSSDYGYLNQVFTKIPEITKEQLFAYDEDPRQVIINYNSEIGCLMEAKLSLDEILTLDPKMRDALIDKALVFKELVNSSPHPQITKKVLLNLLSQDIRSFYLHTSTQNKNLLAKLVQLELDNSVSVVNTPATTFSPKSSKNQKEKAVADKEVSKCQCILL